MATLKRFSKGDWDALSGSTPFADGADPLIGEVAIDFGDGSAPVAGLVVVDGEGLVILACDDAGIEAGYWCAPYAQMPMHEALLFATSLPATVSVDTLTAAGLQDQS